MTYAFGEHELDVDRLELRLAGVHVPMEPQTFDVLTYLVRHRERVVPEEELMDEVRGGRFVSETAVTSGIKQARRPRRRRAVAEVHPDPTTAAAAGSPPTAPWSLTPPRRMPVRPDPALLPELDRPVLPASR